MLSEKQIEEVRGLLEKVQNPVFFFDSDTDGLCSFLVLQKFSGKGKGVPVKSPKLGIDYFRRIDEFNSDSVFILDKPEVSEEFFQEIQRRNIPVVWIDHHKVSEKIPENVNYYNPSTNKNFKGESTTYMCYKISGRKEDLWLGVIGSISDKFFPDFYDEFMKKYPDLGIETKDAYDVYYRSQIGRIGRIFSFAMKDRTTNVINMIRFLMKAKTPYDVLEELKDNRTMHKRFNEINSKYRMLLDKAQASYSGGKILFFKYGGDLSISSDLSNELMYRNPNVTIVVAYASGGKANISMRGKNVLGIVLKAIRGFEGATGGGHNDAVGAQIKSSDLDEFRKRVEMEVI